MLIVLPFPILLTRKVIITVKSHTKVVSWWVCVLALPCSILLIKCASLFGFLRFCPHPNPLYLSHWCSNSFHLLPPLLTSLSLSLQKHSLLIRLGDAALSLLPSFCCCLQFQHLFSLFLLFLISVLTLCLCCNF